MIGRPQYPPKCGLTGLEVDIFIFNVGRRRRGPSFRGGYMKRVELRQLECFITLAEELNFARAATRLAMTQPPLTRQIRRLEETIGASLFARTTRRVELTPAGRAYLPEARAALEQIRYGIEVAQKGARGEVGELIIAIEASSIFDPFLKSIRIFRERYPLINLIVRSIDTDDQADALREGKIEVGFIVPPIRDTSIAVEHLMSMALIAVLPANHRLAAQDSVDLMELANEPFVLSPAGHKCGLLDKVVTACRTAGFTPRVAQEAGEMQLMLAFVAEGIGVSILPECVSRLGKPGVACRPLTGCKSTLELAIAWRKGMTSSLFETFAGVVREVRDSMAASADRERTQMAVKGTATGSNAKRKSVAPGEPRRAALA